MRQQTRLRLPNAFEFILALSVALLFFMALSARRGQRIATLEAVLAARPATEEQVRLVRVSGPIQWRTRIETKPGGEKIIERWRSAGPSEVREDRSHEETPACAPETPRKSRWASVTIAPGDIPKPYSIHRAAAGITLWDRLDIGGSYDWRYNAAGIDVGVRF